MAEILDNFNIKRGKNVPTTIYMKAIQSTKFINWLNTLDTKRNEFKDITVEDVIMFGPTKVGFILANAATTNRSISKFIPGYCFIRGHAVTVFTLLRVVFDDEEMKNPEYKDKHNKIYMVLTEQDRIPTGGLQTEIPAGMMDEDNNFSSVAVKELKEETGLDINETKHNLYELGEFYPSQGGCDEKITSFYTLFHVSPQKLYELQNKITGNIQEGEMIKLHIKPLTIQNILDTKDSKAICSMLMFLHHQKLVSDEQFVYSEN